MKQYILVLVLAVLAAVFVPGCATAPSSTVARYHFGSELPQQTPMVTAVPAVVVVETPPQPRVVWVKTNQGYVQAYEEKNQTYVVNGAGEMIPIPSGTGLDIVYVEPRDIQVMRQESRSDFYALLRADQQNHRESMDWARYRLQKDEQEHQQMLEERRQDLREQEQLVDNIQDLNQMRNQNVLLGTNTIPTPAQIQERRQAPVLVRVPEQRGARSTVPSVSKPLVVERRVERAEVAEQRKPVVVPPKKRTSAPVVTREPVVTRQSTSARPERQKMVVRPEAGSQPRTRDGRVK